MATLAPFAGHVNATAVDICTDTGALIVADLKYPQVLANLELPPGQYNLKIAVPGTNCAMTALDLPEFSLVEGDVRDAFAIGKSLLGGAFPVQLATTTGLRPASEEYLPLLYRSAAVLR